MTLSDFRDTLDDWGKNKIPFLFVVDFEMKKPRVFPLSQIDPREIRYQVETVTNAAKKSGGRPPSVDVVPGHPARYLEKFSVVHRHLVRGDSYLTNLTIKTKIELNSGLDEIFDISHAPFKLLFKNEFLVFSPERFVKIEDGRIYAYPMKGTISASVPRAAEVILGDIKERAEHVTIVDLIRNDLSRVAENVGVPRFRYIDRIRTTAADLLQVSSEVSGDVFPQLQQRLGTLLVDLLPAGSVSGAPKKKTLEIIREAESEARGYYTGVFGIFDGKSLDSAVMIRFIENINGEFFYRSGGGITTLSDATSEYQEALAKIYVPLN